MSYEYWIQFRDGFHPSEHRVVGDPIMVIVVCAIAVFLIILFTMYCYTQGELQPTFGLVDFIAW